jgi:hypothetical protein
MMKRLVMLIAAAALFVTTPAFTSDAEAGVRNCKPFKVSYANMKLRAYDFRAYRISCYSARALLRAAWHGHVGLCQPEYDCWINTRKLQLRAEANTGYGYGWTRAKLKLL